MITVFTVAFLSFSKLHIVAKGYFLTQLGARASLTTMLLTIIMNEGASESDRTRYSDNTATRNDISVSKSKERDESQAKFLSHLYWFIIDDFQ